MALNVGYVKSIQGILKILEIITICIAFACLADFDRDVTVWGGKYPGRFDFFISVFVIGWVVVVFVFLVFLLSFEGKIMTEKNWNLLLLIFSILFALLFVVASGLMADFLDDLYEAKWHKFRSSRKYSDILTVSVFFGFASAVLLAVDAFFFLRKSRAK